MASINFAQLDKLLSSKSVEAAVKYLMEEAGLSRAEATFTAH